ncbi:PstS family phosphate ABC transporter substrate-binding protein [Streptomyces sp. NPDC002643]
MQDWLSAENVVAVATAVVGVAASALMVWYERRVPRRKRIGYRVQMDNPIGHEVRSGRANVRLGLFGEGPDMSDATLVLLRVENDGSQSIADNDYTGRELHGLTAIFSGRVIRGVSVTQPPGTDHLMDHFTPSAGFGYRDGVLRIPRVPLNRGDHFKLLVLLSGGDVGSPIRLSGGIRDGEVHPNRSATPDDKAPLFSRPARLITVLLTLCVIALAAIIVVRDDTPPPIECETGELTLTGSTAFAPVLRGLAEDYEKECPGSEIEVDARGSSAGVNELSSLGGQMKKGSPSVIAFSDGPSTSADPQLVGHRVALSVFTLVVNDGVHPPRDSLTLDDVRRIYSGEITRWRQLGPSLPDIPVVLVSRDADSGTRQVFQRMVLDGWERVASTSLDCRRDDLSAAVTRCELDSTEQVLAKVAEIPGAIGYTELTLAAGRPGLRRLSLDGHAASVDRLERGDATYPYYGAEYAYTYRRPAADSLADSFLAHIRRGTAQNVIRGHGHVPCETATGARLCDERARDDEGG